MSLAAVNGKDVLRECGHLPHLKRGPSAGGFPGVGPHRTPSAVRPPLDREAAPAGILPMRGLYQLSSVNPLKRLQTAAFFFALP